MHKTAQSRIGLISAMLCPTLAITWPQGVLAEEDSLVEAARVNGGVRRMETKQSIAVAIGFIVDIAYCSALISPVRPRIEIIIGAHYSCSRN